MAKTDSSSGSAPEDASADRLSTAPVEETGPSGAGSFGGVRRPGLLGALGWGLREATGWLRWFWRQLTSMRVALILLLLLSLATIPGSLIPQTSVDSVKVDDWKKGHQALTPAFEKLQLFHVYSSVWFSAVYILLFISLIGCIVPRTWQFVGQLRSRPPRAPRRLDRMPAYATWRTEADPEQVLARAGRLLKGKRFRTEPGEGSVAGEKGYLREAGNLVFHVSLIVLLVAFASGQLWKSEGGKLIVQGDGFSNTLTQYDDFKSGSLFTPADLPRFSFFLDDFEATYEVTGPQRGTPRTYAAHVTYYKGTDNTPHKTTIKVNDPLVIDGSKIYLQGHGYAPVVTVKDGKGNVAYQGAVASLPLDSNITENVVLKVPDFRDKEGAKDQVGFTGLFIPTLDERTGTMLSQFPDLVSPGMVLTAFHGSLGMDSGVPQSVYKLDVSKMKQFTKPDGKSKLSQLLRVGQTMNLPNGGTLHFDGIKPWATFQISQKPGDGPALAGAVAAILGVAGSLFIQRRRVWVRAVRAADGSTVVELAGLGRSESAKVPEELADLAAALQTDAPPVPDDPSTSDAPPTPDEGADTTEPSESSEGARA
ncbi:cytochrome c biogenesis protein ResB [Streptomyces orinoci]|uniref:Cytochrome c biogenesis protein ResB n=1 Tax=Streptomyces orinoci TaxID=67339 RepID=A0ABV3K3N7_STRON|nr:cytochrome c biogenesis protein ResB [Streptomyces orinoci]